MILSEIAARVRDCSDLGELIGRDAYLNRSAQKHNRHHAHVLTRWPHVGGLLAGEGVEPDLHPLAFREILFARRRWLVD
jgi:hypothetical protein